MRPNLGVNLDSDPSHVPLLMRENAMQLEVTSHVESWRSQYDRWQPEDYYNHLAVTFPRLQHISYNEPLDGSDGDVFEFVSHLEGGPEPTRDMHLEHDDLEVAAPADDRPQFTFTIGVPQDWYLRHGDQDLGLIYPGLDHIYCIYVSCCLPTAVKHANSCQRFDINALNGDIAGRYVNLETSEMKAEIWVPVIECCVMVRKVSWHVLYHKPSGHIRVLICQREMDSNAYDDDLDKRQQRNDIADQVKADLACEETLKKALKVAYELDPDLTEDEDEELEEELEEAEEAGSSHSWTSPWIEEDMD